MLRYHSTSEWQGVLRSLSLSLHSQERKGSLQEWGQEGMRGIMLFFPPRQALSKLHFDFITSRWIIGQIRTIAAVTCFIHSLRFTIFYFWSGKSSLIFWLSCWITLWGCSCDPHLASQCGGNRLSWRECQLLWYLFSLPSALAWVTNQLHPFRLVLLWIK